MESPNLSYARASYAIAVTALGLYAVFAFASRFGRRGIVWAAASLGGVGVLVLLFVPWIEFLSKQDDLRPGSSRIRLLSYQLALEHATSNGPFVFIAGAGAKPYVEQLGFGAGSESTLFSLVVRGGVIGITLFLAFIFARLVRAYGDRDWALMILVGAVAAHALVEDLDTGALTLVFLLLSMNPSNHVADAGESSGENSVITPHPTSRNRRLRLGPATRTSPPST